ncbi:hypothetical protein [Streptomyces sp. NPDC048411]|uniref:hypothetical protein n=1 Tax=Streptomyces sp. NPDC048411 TaxID=3157206 RepID=UPI0034552BC8
MKRTDDITVVGSGDIPFGAVPRPRLTTTFFDLPSAAAAVGTTIERLLAGQDPAPASPLTAQPHLITRDSA